MTKAADGSDVRRLGDRSDVVRRLADDTDVVRRLADDTDVVRRLADDTDVVRRLAHELSAPLTSLELRLLRLKQERPQSEIAESCLREIASMKHLVASLLELDGPPLQPHTVALGPVMQRLHERFQPIAASREVTLVVHPADASAMGNAGAIERILSNLIDNAIKFSRTEGRVEVKSRTSIEGVELTVRDDGIGMTPTELARAFEPFYRADREAPGAGLGLAICRHLAEAQHGSLRGESDSGRGTSFVLTLPPAT